MDLKRLGMLCLAGLAFAGPAAAQGTQSTERVFPYEYRRFELPNGLVTYLIAADAPGQVAYLSIVRTGSRDEVEPGKSGFAHFFEHMMFRGTEKYPNFDEIMAEIGASRNAFTSSDMTVYYAVAANDHLERMIDLESDRFMNLRYSEPDFRTEAGAVLGEYQQSATTPFGFLNQRLRETAFDQHTYQHTTIGFEADVRAMPEGFDYSLDFHRRHYRPENVVLVLAGDIDFDRAERLIREYYSPWKPGYVAPQIPTEPAQTAPRDRTIVFPGRTLPMVSVNWRAPKWDPRDRTAVATEVLGRVAFGPTSDVYRKLVLRERKVGSLSASFGLQRDPYLAGVTASVLNPADTAAVKAEILATARRFREELVDEQALAAAKSNMKYGFLMGLETPESIAFAMIQPVVMTGGIEAVEEYYRTLEAVTAEDVRRAARQVLVDAGRTTLTMIQQEGQ
ncbi:MAG TPA: pitrilysin family protein [Longimicrobiaceae bacterium]|nr:pitrilysin family protein [Longimicrobiaceae bacterium]